MTVSNSLMARPQIVNPITTMPSRQGTLRTAFGPTPVLSNREVALGGTTPVLIPDAVGAAPLIDTGNQTYSDVVARGQGGINPSGLYSGGFNTQLPTQTTTGSSVFNPVDPVTGSVPSGGNVGAVTGTALLSGLLTGNLGDALRGAGEYYLGQEGVEGAYQTGVTGLEMAQELGQRSAEAAQFKPYTVTSNLARIGTDPSGGFTAQLSPEQQAIQRQAMSQAGTFLGQTGAIDPSLAAQRGAVGGLFGQTLGQYGQPTGLEGITQAGLTGAQAQLGAVGQPADIEALRAQYAGLAGAAGEGLLTSPEAKQAEIFEAIRATQRPEEERQRLALEERLLSQGRLGLSSAAYGGASPELLAQETARQEAMARASLSARQQAMSEQQQALATATGLTGLASGLAGTSSQLETAGIGRGTALANLGLTGTQAGRALQQQDLANILNLQQSDIGAAQAQQLLQQGRLGLGTGLLGAGYMPQQQALALLEASRIPAQLQQTGQLAGAELQAQLGGRGIESYMQGADLANRLQLQQQQGLLSSLMGQQPTLQEQLINRILGGKDAAPLTGSDGWLGSLFNLLNKDKSSSPPSASASQLMFANAMGLTPEQLLAGISGPSAEEELALEDLTDY